MKNCEFLRAQNEKKDAQNEYLRKQLHDSMRRRRRAIRSLPHPVPPILSGLKKKERNPTLRDPVLKMEPLGVQGVEGDNQPLNLRLRSWSLKED